MRDYAFGNRLAALRQERGYSQFQLASLIGVSDKAVSKWETGAAKPRLKIWPRLAVVLGVDQSDFFGTDMHPSPTGGYIHARQMVIVHPPKSRHSSHSFLLCKSSSYRDHGTAQRSSAIP